MIPSYVIKDMVLSAQDRVIQLENDYRFAQSQQAWGLSAIIKGEIRAARAYLQAMKDVRAQLKEEDA